MKTTYGIFAKATTCRDLDKLPVDWTVIATVAKPASHKWDNPANVNSDAIKFTKNVLAPMGKYLAAHGIEVDFGGINLVDMVEDRHIYKKLPHFYANSGDKEYVYADDEDGNKPKTQYRVRRNKKMQVTGATPVAILDATTNTVWALDAKGNRARNTHTFLDFFAMARQEMENCINFAIAEQYGGHVRVKLNKIGSVAVNGTA